MIFRAAILLSLLTAGGAHAQQVVVRSGEHGSFTRLAFDVPRGTSWRSEREGDKVILTLQGHQSGFATGDVFDRIDRSRLSVVQTTDSQATLTLACACSINAFAANESMIVIDITGPQTIADEAPEVVARAIDLKFEFGALVSEQPLAPDLSLPSSRSEPRLEMSTLPVPSAGPVERWAETPALPETVKITETYSLSGLQDQLSREVATAATRGVLDAVSTPMMPTGSSRPQIDLQAFDMDLPQAEVPLDDVNSAIRITTAMDFQGSELPTQLTGSQWGPGCMEPSGVAIGDWTDGRPIAAQVADARGRLYGEFDQIDLQTTIKLARIYLHFGFGPEAMRLLALSTDLQAEHGLLLEMGEIMEFGFVRTPRVLKSYVECDSALALWAILSLPSIPQTMAVNTNAALRALSGLPRHLRSFLAPELSRRFLAYGDAEAASAAVRSIERMDGPINDDIRMAQADLILAEGNVPAAQEKLEKVISSNSEQSAEALIKFIATQIDEGTMIDPATAQLVEAYSVELRNAPLGSELRRTHILALKQSGQFDAAFAAIDALSPAEDSTAQSDLTDHVLGGLTRNGDDPTFLSIVFQLAAEQGLQLTVTTRVDVARRLLDLGFGAAAETLLADTGTSDKEVQLLKAEIALSMDRPSLSEARLLGIEGIKADSLRARARQMNGQYLEATNLYIATGKAEDAIATAFLSEDWRTRVNEDTEILGPLTTLSNTEFSVDPSRDGMLARTSSTLDESTRARAVINSLLDADLDRKTPSEN